MKTKVAAIYGKRDVRLREFELPEITDNELLVSVISDSVCLSTWKAALLCSEHKTRTRRFRKSSGHYRA
ncbi:putative oxidoreductase [Escherichia coli]|nr:putative oxidoreductase [Escherichia coli]